jgi:hypothetical protein
MKNIYVAIATLMLTSSAYAQSVVAPGDWSKAPAFFSDDAIDGKIVYPIPMVVGNDQSVVFHCGNYAPYVTPCANGAYAGDRAISITDFATATSVEALQQNMSSMNSSLSGLSNRVGGLEASVGNIASSMTRLRKEERRGIAGVAAMSYASMPSEPGRTSWAVNTSNFIGEVAVGGSIAHRFNTRLPFAITAGASLTSLRLGVYRVGLAGEF